MSAAKANTAPLPDAPDPYHYVPLAEHERALSALRDALNCGMSRLLLLGPPGFGKSLLLRRLKADPPPATRVFYLPFANLGADELAPWLLSWMGSEGGSVTDDDFLAWNRIERRLGRKCVLLLDEAQSLSVATARRLDDWVARSNGGLQVVLAGIEGADLLAVLEGFREAPHRIGLRKPLRGEALRNFVHSLIHRSLGERGNAPTWLWKEEELFAVTEGVPRVIKAEIGRRLAEAARRTAKEVTPAAVEAAQRVSLSETQRESDRAPTPPVPPADPGGATPLPHVTRRAPRRRRWPAAALLLLLCSALLWPSMRGPAATPPEGVAPAAVALDRTVSLHINAFPWAEIRVDGEPVGITPLAGLEVYPGPHELVATFPDGRELIKRIDLRAESNSITFP